MQPLKFFTDREMSTLIRIEPKTGRETEVYIKDEAEAVYQHSLQESGYLFRLPVKIHRARPGECESCSA